jgi:hypothetical protein
LEVFWKPTPVMSMFAPLMSLNIENTPPFAFKVTLPVAAPLAEKAPELTTLMFPATLNVIPEVMLLAGLASVTSPLPVVVMLKRPSPAPMVSAPSGPAGCVTLVPTAVTVKPKGPLPLMISGTPGLLATRRLTLPAFTTSVPILLLEAPRSTESGTENVGAASIVSEFAVTTPAPAESCTTLVNAVIAFVSSDIVFALSGALMAIVGAVSAIELSELTAALFVTLFEAVAASDELFSVTAALKLMSCAARESVDAAPPRRHRQRRGDVDEALRCERDVAAAEQRGDGGRQDLAVGAREVAGEQVARRQVVARRAVAVDVGDGADRDRRRVEQQASPGAQRRAQVGTAREIEGALARHFRLPAVAALGAAARVDLPGVGRVAVGPDDDLAAVALRRRVGVEHDAAADEGLCRVRLRALAVPVAADEDRPSAGRARGVQACLADKADAVAEHLDRPARCAGTARGVELAADHDHSARAARQHDLPVALLDAARAHDAADLHHRAQGCIGGSRLQAHRAAVGGQRARVFRAVH